MKPHPASFRDPSGHIFTDQDKLYRQINPIYFQQFKYLIDSGLYNELTSREHLITHKELKKTEDQIIIQPKKIPFISYPTEWTFEAIKDAALLCLNMNLTALKYNMILKDASIYNIQFVGTKPIFIDTLSFDFYQKNKPWRAFGQFIRHFLCPLLLMKYKATDMSSLLVKFIDGIPLDITSCMLPIRTHFSPFIKTNIHMHSKALKHNGYNSKNPELTKKSLINIIKYNISFIQSLTLKQKTSWSDYYQKTNYDKQALDQKTKITKSFLEKINPQTVLDVGGNDGRFSKDENQVILCDSDHSSINRAFLENKKADRDILHILCDITNPTPAYGFSNQERYSFLDRIKEYNSDCILALALIHHLCISNNCSFDMVAKLFSSISEHLIIEFVDRSDSQVIRLLDNIREEQHLFDFYNHDNFKEAFLKYFNFESFKKIDNTHRTVYYMRRNKNI